MKTFKALLATILVAICVAERIDASLTININATATEMITGEYEYNKSYNFAFVLNENYLGSQGDCFDSEVNQWSIYQKSWGQVILDVYGDGMYGTYEQASYGGEFAPYEYVRVSTNFLEIYTRCTSDVNLGTLDAGDAIYLVQAGIYVNDFSFDVSSSSFIPMDSYFADYPKTYTVSGDSYFEFRTFYGGLGSFKVNSITTSAVPEPATAGLLVISGGVLFMIRRIKKAMNYYRT